MSRVCMFCIAETNGVYQANKYSVKQVYHVTALHTYIQYIYTIHIYNINTYIILLLLFHFHKFIASHTYIQYMHHNETNQSKNLDSQQGQQGQPPASQ